MRRDYKSGLKKSELEDGAYYKGECRNASEARWDAKTQRFYHWRTKFMDTFIESICHYEDEDHYDIFEAYEKIETPEKEIPFPNAELEWELEMQLKNKLKENEI